MEEYGERKCYKVIQVQGSLFGYVTCSPSLVPLLVDYFKIYDAKVVRVLPLLSNAEERLTLHQERKVLLQKQERLINYSDIGRIAEDVWLFTIVSQTCE